MEQNKRTEFNSLSLLLYIYKWRKQLIIITAAAVIISSIISLTIKPKFKSTVILFPGITYSASKSLIANNPYRPDVTQFGDEEEAEQMLQILNSNEVREKICKKHNLMKHYQIDSTGKLAKTALQQEFYGNITFERTKYMSVRIDVMDHDPVFASNIANDIAAYHDSARYSIQKQRALIAYNIIKGQYDLIEKEVRQLQDSVQFYNMLGIVNLEDQSKVTSQQLVKAIAKNDQRAVNALQEKFNVLAKYGSAFVSARDKVYMQRNYLNDLKIKLDEAKVDLDEVLPQKFVVSLAEPAEKKAYPVRWVIVAISTFTTIFIGLLMIFIFENFRQLKKQNN